MYDYMVVRIGFTVNGTEYNVGDRVTGADADVVHADPELQKRCTRVERDRYDKIFATGKYAAQKAPAAVAEPAPAPPAATAKA